MAATLEQLGREKATRRIAVLGAMKELGEHGPGYHAGLAGPLRAAGINHAILVGEEMAALAGELGKPGADPLGKAIPFAHCESVAQALDAVRAFGLESGDAVLVKGSNSVGLAKLVAALAGKED